MSDRTAARASLLQELSIEVSRAPDARSVGAAVVRLGRALLDAVSGVLWLLDPDDPDRSLDVLATDGVPEAFIDQWRRILPNDPSPAMYALDHAKPLWIASLDEYRAAIPSIAERAERANRPMAFAALPLAVEERKLGVIVFGFRSPHPFTVEEQALALAIAGHAAQALDRARLQTAQARALAALRVIAKVGETIAASLDVDATLTALAKAVVPDVADWCAIDMFVDRDVRRLIAYHADPAKVALANEYAERFPERLDDPKSSLARIITTGETIWVRRITREMFDRTIADPAQRALLDSLGLRSVVQTPLVSEGRVRGAVSFIMSDSGREYDEIDRDLLVEIGRRAALALTNAALYAREQRARERVTGLAALTAALARAPTTVDVGEVACRDGAAALGAATAALYVLDGDRLRLAAQHAYSPENLAQYRIVPMDVDIPLTRAVRTHAPVVVEGADELRREFPAMFDPDGSPRRTSSIMCKPLADRHGHIVGVLGFGFVGEQDFSDDDRAFARTLAEHCAQAFDRARILDLERRARDRVALLAAAGETFSATIDYEATLEAVVRIALPTLADFGFFDVVESDGTVRRTSNAYDDPEVAAILSASRWVRSERTDINLCALSTGKSAIHPDIDDAFLKDMATSEAHLDVLRALHLCSMITVPVVVRGETIGALTLCYGKSGRHHTNDDLDLALELARRGATAVEQARLYRASKDAARRAEEANRVKDDFLATVSHELRTPLNAILGWAHLLDAERLSDPAFLRRGLDVIRRNANVQREIIEDILDVSRIITGKLRIASVTIDLATVARDALEVVRPAADAKGVHLVAQGIDEPAPFVGDGARLQQVVWNLLSNAVKFTPSGGTVRIELVRSAESMTVRVSDDGIGIAPDILPFVFDRFRQADSSSTRAQGGLGLGLSIVRHLVELHGGTVWASSQGRGRGATFEVNLPTVGRASPPPPVPAPDAPHAAAPTASSIAGLRVLVVDDDRDSRELLGVMLRAAGADVIVAENAADAIARFESRESDVVVSDIAMPDVDGYALLGMLQRSADARGRRLRAIALTAYDRSEDRASATRAGFAAHVAKPVEPRVLIDTIARVAQNNASVAATP